MEINEIINGFKVTNIRPVSGGRFVEMEHEKTGARLGWMDNGCENKTFSVSFKTVPSDHTGVFHILEHSVLCGSDKYPVKEPFLYLLKGSMNTFLNAMTFDDKTMFPVSSRNDRDFMNLTRIYLDAVFKPSIYREPNIFRQEGHHIEWLNDGSEPLFKGVVFNEMKGAMSSVSERIEVEMMGLLFPDSSYRFVAGGLPNAIPDLTYEGFLAAHRRFYHPSNSYIYLDGKVNMGDVLPVIEEYLSGIERETDLPEIPVQEPIKPCTAEKYYEITPAEDDSMKTYIAQGKVLASWEEREKVFALAVLSDVLAGSNDSPFKRKILDTGLCLDLSLDLYSGIAQPFGVLRLKNTDADKGGELLSRVREIAEEILKKGLGRETVLAAIDRYEFRFRESEEPKGLERGIAAMSAWLYGGDPLYYVECGEIFDRLRELADTDYYERLMHEWLLDERGQAVLYMLPSRTYGDEERAAEKARLDAALSAMTDAEKSKLVELNRGIALWQETPDSPEAAATIPILPLSEISPEPEKFVTEIDEGEGFTILEHPSNDGGGEITAVNLYFDVSDFTNEELLVLSVLDRVILDLPTSKSSGEEIQRRIMGLLGSVSTNINGYSREDDPEHCRIMYTVSARFLSRNTKAALELIGEIITDSLYDDRELLIELLRQCDEHMKQVIISNGQRFALRRAMVGTSAHSALTELTDGLTNYNYLHELLNNDSGENREPLDAVLGSLRAMAERIFCRARLTAGTASAEKTGLDALSAMLPLGEASAVRSAEITVEVPEKSGVVLPTGVSYAGAVLEKRDTDRALRSVASTVLTYEYLWNEVRVKGGAYGTGCRSDYLGFTSFYSYRDPSPSRSFDIFAAAADFMEEYCDSDEDLTQYIISTIAAGEPLIFDSAKAAFADGMYFRGETHESRRARRKEILSMTKEKLRASADTLRSPARLCVVGAEDAVELCRDKITSVGSI